MVILVNGFMRIVPDYVVVARAEDEKTGTALETSDRSAPFDGGSTITARSPFTLDSPRDFLNTTFVVSAAALLLLVIAGAVAAWFISGRMLRPLQVINEAAQLAGSGTLSHRINLDGPADEVRDLADTFDTMLKRLDCVFQAQRRFTANASHELKTPLATTQTMLEVALTDPSIQADQLRGVAGRVLETTRRSSQTVDALLDLAEAEHRPLQTDVIEMKPLVAEVLRCVEGEAAEKAIELFAVLRDVNVIGDVVLIRQAILNLLTNAIRHNDVGGIVEITLAPSGTVARISVQNTGAVLTQSRLRELVEPFARGAGRTADAENVIRGNGLGLALVTSVMEAHHGSIDLDPRSGGGLIANLTLPMP